MKYRKYIIIFLFIFAIIGCSTRSDKLESESNVPSRIQENKVRYIDKVYENHKLIVIISSIGIVVILFLVMQNKSLKKLKKVSSQLEYLLEKFPKIDILQINLTLNQIVSTTNFRFLGKKNYTINKFTEYFNEIDYSFEEYVKTINDKIKNNKDEFIIDYSANVNGELRFFREYGQINNKTEISSLIMDVSNEVKKNEELLRELEIDKLTGLYNRRVYKEEINKLINRYNNELGVFIFIDLNYFKKINDTYGHEFGDLLLEKFSKSLRQFADYKSVIFRIAGDEFGIYKQGFLDEEDITIYLEHVCDELTISREIKGLDLNISCAIGAAIYNKHSNLLETLIDYADFAMYMAKEEKGKKSNYKLFNREAYKNALSEKYKKENLIKVLGKHEYHCVFQPIIDVKTMKLWGVEGLTRIDNSVYRDISEFLDICKSIGKDEEASSIFGRNVLSIYAEKYKESDVKLFVNVIIAEYNNEIFEKQRAKEFGEYMVKFGMNPGRVVLEASERNSHESALFQNVFREYKEAGFKVAVDDFGSGYANEQLIIKLKPDIVKLDKSLIKNINKDEYLKILTANIIKTLKMLDIKIVVEGVETKEEFEFLRDLDVEYMQGFYIQRPVPIEELREEYIY